VKLLAFFFRQVLGVCAAALRIAVTRISAESLSCSAMSRFACFEKPPLDATARSSRLRRTGTFLATRRFPQRKRLKPHSRGEQIMLGWALTFLVVALVAAVLEFGGIAGLSIEIAKIIFFVAVVLFLISAVVGIVRGRSPTVQ